MVNYKFIENINATVDNIWIVYAMHPKKEITTFCYSSLLQVALFNVYTIISTMPDDWMRWDD